MIDWPTMLGRLALAMLLSALIGIERESHERAAGMRTHILVGLGACLAMMLGMLTIADKSNPARIAQGIFAGIGFLGAGSIIHYGVSVRGLTTAASIWASASISLAIGMGWYWAGVATAVLVILTLTVLRLLEAHFSGKAPAMRIHAQLRFGVHFPHDLMAELDDHGIEVVRLDIHELGPDEATDAHIILQPPSYMTSGAVLALVRESLAITVADTEPAKR